MPEQQVQLKDVVLPMQLVAQIMNILNDLPYKQVVNVVLPLTEQIRNQAQAGQQNAKEPVPQKQAGAGSNKNEPTLQ